KAVGPLTTRPPKLILAVLLITWESIRVSAAVQRRPPLKEAELPGMTQSRSTRLCPTKKTPPPALSMFAPVVGALALVIVNPLTVRSVLLDTLLKNTRLVLLPLIESSPGPGPLTDRESVITNWPLVSVMVPVTEKPMVSDPGAALASSTAWRSEPGPLSARVV